MYTGKTQFQSQITVDLGAIDNNCQVIRNHIGKGCGFCAVVKANGYGLGAVRVASRLAKHSDLLAVYGPDEAGELLSHGITTPILVLAPVYSIDRFHPMYRGLSSGQVHLAVHGEVHMNAICRMAHRFGFSISVHVKIDTGLHRGGCDLGNAKKIIELIQCNTKLQLKGVMTHFISAVNDDELTLLQHNRLNEVLQSLDVPLHPDCYIHEANTAAMVKWRGSHRNMVRVGLAWTGSVPEGINVLDGFKPVISWTTAIAHVRRVAKGELVGYSGRWIAQRDSLIGIVPVGYAAGYPIGVGSEAGINKAFVNVLNCGDAPVIGAICMDQIAIDLTAFPASEIATGIELISTDQSSKASLQHLAKVAGVVPHAIISRISPNVPRAYKTVMPVSTICQQTLNVRYS